MAKPKSKSKSTFPHANVVLVPLAQLVPLSGLYGLSNRTPDPKMVRDMFMDWKPVGCDPLLVWQESTECTHFHILAGHHRYEVFLAKCREAGQDPAEFMVPVKILTPADARADGQTNIEFVEHVVRVNNFQSSESTSDYLEMFQTQSPLVAAFATHGLSLEYKGSKRTSLNYSAFLRAFITTIKMFSRNMLGEMVGDTANAASKANMEEMEAVFRGRPWPATMFKGPRDLGDKGLHELKANEVLLMNRPIHKKVFKAAHGDLKAQTRLQMEAIQAISQWELTVATPLHRENKISVRLADELIFVLLLTLDTDNWTRVPGSASAKTMDALLADIADRFTRPRPPFRPYQKPRGSVRCQRDVINHMLTYMNRNRPRHNWVHLLNSRSL